MSFKRLTVGLIVLSDGLVYFLKIEKENCRIHQNYLVALSWDTPGLFIKSHSQLNIKIKIE